MEKSCQGHLTEKFINYKSTFSKISHRCCVISVFAASIEEARHQFCPTGEDSWCKYQANKDTYRPKFGLSIAIREFIKTFIYGTE